MKWGVLVDCLSYRATSGPLRECSQIWIGLECTAGDSGDVVREKKERKKFQDLGEDSISGERTDNLIIGYRWVYKILAS